MNYVKKLEAIETVKEIFSAVGSFFKMMIIAVLTIIRIALNLISTIGVYIFGIFFLPGIYFAYTVVRDMQKGITFWKMQYSGLFLFCFCIPLIFGVIKALTEPKY